MEKLVQNVISLTPPSLQILDKTQMVVFPVFGFLVNLLLKKVVITPQSVMILIEMNYNNAGISKIKRASIHFLKLHMCMYLRIKFKVSSVILTSLRQWSGGGGEVNFTPSPTSKWTPKNPTKIRVKFEFKLICITEVCCSDNLKNQNLFNVSQYKNTHQDRKTGKGGGISAILHESVTFNIRDESMSIIFNTQYHQQAGNFNEFESYVNTFIAKNMLSCCKFKT